MADTNTPMAGVSGAWPYLAPFPYEVSIAGHTFALADFSGFYAGVIAQYREMVPFHSLHLLVRNDGTYLIDHEDDYNPDMGYPLQHLVVDYIPSRKGLLVTAAAVLGVSSIALHRRDIAEGVTTPRMPLWEK